MAVRRESRWQGGYVPAELNDFVGRRDLLSVAKAKLADPRVRLLSLTGGGGTGKSRLAVRLAGEARRGYPDGCWWVDLASLTDPALVDRAVLEALPIDDQSVREPVEILVATLAERNILLVLDNCEHLISAVATLMVRLLRACRELRVLTTSRVPLRCEGEHLLDVPPMVLPDDPDRAFPAESEAVRLFEARAVAAKAAFAITEENAAEVARLVRLLDGIPLAIELAAPLVRVMSLPEIVSLLATHRFGTLTKGPSTPTHHRTLWDTFEWSYQLCAPAERLLWVRLSVFAGSFTADAAVAVVSDAALAPAQVPMVLRDMVGKSVVVADTDSAPTRYAMLATVREYGLARLRSSVARESDPLVSSASDDEVATRRRFSSYYLERALHYGSHWYGSEETRYLWEAGQDLPNYRAILEQCGAAATAEDAGTAEDAEIGARIALSLTELRLWFFGGSLAEGLRALLRADEALAAAHAAAALRLTVLAKAAWIALCQGDEDNAADLLDRFRALAPQLAGDERTGVGLATLDYVSGVHSLLARADPSGVAQLAAASDALMTAGDPGTAPMADLFHAIACAFLASDAEALAVTERHLSDTQAHGAAWAISWAQWARGLAELGHGDPMAATSIFRTALRAQWELGDRWGSVWCVEALAWAAAARGYYEGAALLLGAASNMQRVLGVAISGLAPWSAAHTACVDQVRSALGDAYGSTESYGSGMSVEDTIDLALGQHSGPRQGARPSVPTPMSGLSEKQQKVAELVAEGRTDKQIAAALFVSPRTVQSHVSAILRGLGFARRTEIAKWVLEQRTRP